jgi:ABC-type multidrug transport system fused ATPase/permease subunit
MISHRVSALSRCDRCIVLEDGMVSADGTHQELLAMDGFYREIAELQKLEHIEEESA